MDDLYPFASHYFPASTAATERQHYLDEGKGEAVVCVHGNPTWSFMFRDLINNLSDRFRVIAPDHLGMGHSDKPQNYAYNLETHIDNLERLLDAIAPNEKISLVVHDWGGAIGCGWAVRHPERVAKIVVLNTAAFLAPHIPPLIALARVPFLGDFVVRGLNAFVRLANRMTTVKPLLDVVRRDYAAPYDSWKNRIAVLRFVQDVPMNSRHPSYPTLRAIDEKLSTLEKLPMLIQWGQQDWCFHRYFYDEWRRRFPSAHADLYPDAGHYLLEDAGGQIIPRIREFLSA